MDKIRYYFIKISSELTWKKMANGLFVTGIILTFMSYQNSFGALAFLCLFGITGLVLFNRKMIYLDFYFFLEALFLVYCAGQILFRIPQYNDKACSRLVALVSCNLFELGIYNYYRIRDDFEHLGKTIVKSIVIALAAIIIMNLNLVQGVRLIRGIKIAGKSFGNVNVAVFGWTAGLGLLLCCILGNKMKQRQFYACYAFFSFAVIISGTRHALPLIVVAFLLTRIMKSGNKERSLKNYLRDVLYTVILGTALVFLVLRVPYLYQEIGSRLEEVFLYLFTGKSYGGSLTARMELLLSGIGAFLESPVWGWGLDNFSDLFDQGRYDAHNNYLEIAASGGIIGTGIYFSKYVYLILRLIKCESRAEGQEKKRYLCMILAFFACAVLEFWNITYYSRKTFLFYILILAYVGRGQREK